jgi:phytoene desaturase
MLTALVTTEVDTRPQGRRPHAIVIGSGFGGLAAAIRLGARGYRVTVLERLDAPGGRAYVHRIDGFTFDAGPTIVTAPFLFEELWHLCGRRLSDDIELRPMQPFFRMHYADGSTFDYTGDDEAMRAEIARLSPTDVAGYDRYMRLSAEIFKVGFEDLGDVPFEKWTDMLKILPDMLRLKSYRTVYGLVSQHFKDPRLKIAFSFQPLLIGGNPFTVTSIYALITHLKHRWGVTFAMGGTGRLVEGMVKLIEGQGGEIRLRSDVHAITVANGRATGVQLASGDFLRADIVVSNADSAWTYRHLLPESARRRWTNRRIERARYSNGLFVWYFGTRRQYPAVAHHTIVLGPRYRGLLSDIFKAKRLADDFSLYVHRPTATDPSLAPPGCDAFYALSPVPHLGGSVDWRAEAEAYRQRIARHLSEVLLPDLEANIVVSRVATPLDFESRLLSFRGAGFGLEPVLWQSAWFRPHNRSEEVKNLFLVGHGTHPGAGLPGVLSSARVLDRVVPDVTVFV